MVLNYGVKEYLFELNGSFEKEIMHTYGNNWSLYYLKFVVVLLTQLFAFCSHTLRNRYSLDLCSGDLQITTLLFTLNASSHNTD